MTESWIIIRTAFKQELKVCRQIEALGYHAWLPAFKYIGVRKMPSARRAEIKLKERPITPGLIIAYLNDSGLLEALSWAEVAGVEREGPYGPPYRVPDVEMERFVIEVKRVNDAVERSYAKRLERKQPKKIIFRGLSLDIRDEVMARLFGKAEVPEMQEAA